MLRINSGCESPDLRRRLSCETFAEFLGRLSPRIDFGNQPDLPASAVIDPDSTDGRVTPVVVSSHPDMPVPCVSNQ
jgi:hypothetical protein